MTWCIAWAKWTYMVWGVLSITSPNKISFLKFRIFSGNSICLTKFRRKLNFGEEISSRGEGPGKISIPEGLSWTLELISRSSRCVRPGATWEFLWLYCSYTKFHIFKFYIFLYLYTTTLGALWRQLFDFLPKYKQKIE